MVSAVRRTREEGPHTTHKVSRPAERRSCHPVSPPAPSTTSLISFAERCCGVSLGSVDLKKRQLLMVIIGECQRSGVVFVLRS